LFTDILKSNDLMLHLPCCL